MKKVMKGIGVGLGLVGTGVLGYYLGKEKIRESNIKIRQNTEYDMKFTQLLDSLSYYEEIWEENGLKCKFIVKNNGSNFIKLEKRGKHVVQDIIENDELIHFISHLEEVVWPQGCLFTEKDKEKKSYGRCKFYNDIELYVNPFYFFKGTAEV